MGTQGYPASPEEYASCGRSTRSAERGLLQHTRRGTQTLGAHGGAEASGISSKQPGWWRNGLVVEPAGTGLSCGPVTTKSYAPNEVNGSFNFVCGAFNATNGDSGAGVFEEHTAQGILHGTCKNNGPGGALGFSFSHIEFVLDALGVNLVTT